MADALIFFTKVGRNVEIRATVTAPGAIGDLRDVVEPGWKGRGTSHKALMAAAPGVARMTSNGRLAILTPDEVSKLGLGRR